MISIRTMFRNIGYKLLCAPTLLCKFWWSISYYVTTFPVRIKNIDIGSWTDWLHKSCKTQCFFSLRTLGDIDKLTSSMVEIASSLSASDEDLYNTLTHDLFSFFLVMLQRDSPGTFNFLFSFHYRAMLSLLLEVHD